MKDSRILGVVLLIIAFLSWVALVPSSVIFFGTGSSVRSITLTIVATVLGVIMVMPLENYNHYHPPTPPDPPQPIPVDPIPPQPIPPGPFPPGPYIPPGPGPVICQPGSEGCSCIPPQKLGTIKT